MYIKKAGKQFDHWIYFSAPVIVYAVYVVNVMICCDGVNYVTNAVLTACVV